MDTDTSDIIDIGILDIKNADIFWLYVLKNFKHDTYEHCLFSCDFI